MKQRFLLVCAVISLLISLQAVMPNKAYAISSSDTTAAEGAAVRSAELWCSQNAAANVQEDCQDIFEQGYLGDGVTGPRTDPANQTCPDVNGNGNGCRGAYRAGEKNRVSDFPEVPDELCQTYINAARKSKSAPKELQKIKDGDVSKAVSSCVKGFKIGVGQIVNGSCSGSGYEKVSCEQGEELANLHIFANFEAEGHAQGKSLDQIAQEQEDSTLGDETIENECDADPNPLTWVVCPVINGFNKAIEALDNVINDLASVGNTEDSTEPNRIFCNGSKTPEEDKSNCKAYEEAWASFRNIALGLLVVVLLIIVISQAIGAEFLDAYTIRKMLPRLVAMAIIITLSWEIMQFAVGLSNALGYGVKFLIEAPFAKSFPAAQIGGSGVTAISLIGVGLIGAFTLFGLLSFVITGLLGVLVACLVLVLRQVVIIALAILAPIALLAYILPNTERYYKFWFEAFSKALLMFPMIVGMISVGHVFSAIATTSSTSGIVAQVIGFAAYFAPYFMIPMTFKWSGSLMGAIGNFANNNGLTEGVRGGLSSYRGRKRAERAQNAKDFSMLSDRNKVTRGINNAVGAVATGSFSRKRYRTRKEAGKAAFGARTMKENEMIQTHQGDDNVLLAIADRGLAEEKLDASKRKHERAVRDHSAAVAAHAAAPTAATQAAVEAAEEARVNANREVGIRQHGLDVADSLGPEAKSIGVQRQALSALAKTGFQFSEGEAGYKELRGVAERLSGGDQGAYQSIMNDAQYGLRTSGRYDLGGINNGAGYDPKAGTDKASLYELANGKPESIHGFLDGLDKTTVGHEHAVAYAELKAMLPNAKGKSREAILKGMTDLEGRGVQSYMSVDDGSGETVSYRENYDSSNPTHATGWTAAERQRGWRTQSRLKTFGDHAQEQARTYERPDPNNM